MAGSGRPICVPDVRLDARFPSLAEPERVSWLGIPLIVKGELSGVIAIDKAETGFYSEENLRAGTTFASQAAVALDNARLFEESERRAAQLDERSHRLGLLNRLSGSLGASLDADYILKLTAQELLNALGVDRAAAIMVAGPEEPRLEAPTQFTLRTDVPEGDTPLPLALPPIPLFSHLLESRGLFMTSEVQQEPDLAALLPLYLAPRNLTSLMVVPLLSGADLLGWLLLGSTREIRFSPQEMELARTISNQAATAIQNARLFAETRRLTADLEHRVELRTAEVTREHHNSQTLLRIISELSASLDMDMVLYRTLSVLSESTGAEQSMILLAQSAKVYQAGKDLAGVRAANSARIDQKISRSVVYQRAPIVLDDVYADPRWGEADPLPDFRSVLAVPLILGEDVLGSLMLLHSQPDFFAGDKMHLLEATARQISLSLNNADLFNLIRDQAENLGGMLREKQIEASRSRAILEAVADGVLVTEADNIITLFNASAERILGLEAEQVVSRSLEQFSGLFGKAASAWMETIRHWSEDGEGEQEGETYAEQLELDNGRIVSVHLAPVIMRAEFLGTVSIFRDITHEVQVDRLKTEFVANVSHELRTPMTSIKGYVDIMLLGAAGDIDPRVRHFLEIVRGNTERLSVLVNDLLDVSKIESGHVTLSMRALDMREIAGDVIADITRRSREENKPMAFTLELADGLPEVRGDVERVRQILGNLVSNAYNYTPEGGVVTVRMCAGQQEVIVDVCDNGIGIAPADQARLFERFYRGEDPLVLATAGTGLGLAITRSLVEMHGGRIWFTSSGERGVGSVFSFSLPVMETE
jgi:PAS domain S-box-containing protein